MASTASRLQFVVFEKQYQSFIYLFPCLLYKKLSQLVSGIHKSISLGKVCVITIKLNFMVLSSIGNPFNASKNIPQKYSEAINKPYIKLLFEQ